MHILDLTTGEFCDKPTKKSMWIDINKDELDKLQEYGIATTDINTLKKHRFSTYLEFPKYTGILLFQLHYSGAAFTRNDLLIFIKKECIITIGGEAYLKRFHSNFIIEKGNKEIAKELVVFELLSGIINENAEIGLEIERDIGRLEESVSKLQLNVRYAIAIRKALLRLSRHYLGQRQIIFDFKENRINLLEPTRDLSHKLADLYNSMIFNISLSEQLHAILADVRELHLSTISNRINDSIKKLTVVTVLLATVSTVSVVPNTIATIFGIPYFPLKADTAVGILGIDLFPWQLIIGILVISVILPSWLLYIWWKQNSLRWE